MEFRSPSRPLHPLPKRKLKVVLTLAEEAEPAVDEVAAIPRTPIKSHQRVAAAAVVVEEVLVAPAPEILLRILGKAAGLSLPEIRPIKVEGEEPFV